MKVLVTGSNGFVGKYVVQKLISEGYHVIGIGRTHNDFEHENFSFYHEDITDKEQICDLFKLNSDILGIVQQSPNSCIHPSSACFLKRNQNITCADIVYHCHRYCGYASHFMGWSAHS